MALPLPKASGLTLRLVNNSSDQTLNLSNTSIQQNSVSGQTASTLHGTNNALSFKYNPATISQAVHHINNVQQSTSKNNWQEEKNVMGSVSKLITTKDLDNNQNLQFLRLVEKYSIKASDDNFEDEEMNTKAVENPNVGPRGYNKNVFFYLHSQDNTTYLCCSRDHFPVRKYDAVFGRVKVKIVAEYINPANGHKIHNGGQYYEFVQRPLGMVGLTKEAFLANLASFSHGQIIPPLADKLYDQLIEYYRDRWARKQKRSDAEISSLPIQMVFKEMSYLSEEFRSQTVTGLSELFNGISGKLTKTLLQRWYWYFLRRRLELLGFSRNDISKLNQLGYSMRKIYRLIMRDAFTVLPLSLDEAIRLKVLLNQPFSDRDRMAAMTARKVYHQVMEKKWTGVPDSMVTGYLDEMKDKYGMIHELGTIYFPAQYKKECLVAGRMKMTMRSFPAYQDEIYYRSSSHELTDEQKQAIDFCFQHPICVIKGGAGVGKTVIIEAMAENLERLNVPYAIVAFTGKAVCRIEEGVKSSNKPMTIHRLCYGGWRQEDKFRHLIIDEASMVTIGLMSMIYERFDHDFAVTFVGDNNQLEPIEWGCLFNEILNYNEIPVFTLNKNLRVKGDPSTDGILLNSNKMVNLINVDRQIKLNDRANRNISNVTNSNINNEPNDLAQLLSNNLILTNPAENEEIRTRASILRQAFMFEPRHNFEILPGGLGELKGKIQELINQGISSDDVVIISPFNRHLQNLNNIAQGCFIVPGTPQITYDGVVYYKGDIVRMTTNDYSVEIMTGTTGTLMSFYESKNPYRARTTSMRRYNGENACPSSGYLQVSFITHKIRRFFTNDEDYKIYVWAKSILDSSTAMTSSVNNNSDDFYPENSEIEWQQILNVLNSVYHFYQKYPNSPSDFIFSPEFSQPEVKRLFTPLAKVRYPYGTARDLTLSYAMTVHASEGSDWDYVFGYCDVNDKHSSFLNYHLLYTLITRAKRKICLIGNHNLFHFAALQQPEDRYDNLSIRLNRN